MTGEQARAFLESARETIQGETPDVARIFDFLIWAWARGGEAECGVTTALEEYRRWEKERFPGCAFTVEQFSVALWTLYLASLEFSDELCGNETCGFCHILEKIIVKDAAMKVNFSRDVCGVLGAMRKEELFELVGE